MTSKAAPTKNVKKAKAAKINPENLGRSAGASISAALRVVVATERSGLGKVIDGTHGWDGLIERLDDLSEELRAGKLTTAEDMLMHQAVALQSLFVRLTESAYLANGPAEHFDLKLRYAFRAQAQCRATLETLAAVKNPPVVFAKQANLTTGPQQINNGTPADARTRDDEFGQTKLSGAAIELPQNGGTPALASPANTPMATVGAVGGTADGSGQGQILAERLEGRRETSAARAGQSTETGRATLSPRRLINGRH